MSSSDYMPSIIGLAVLICLIVLTSLFVPSSIVPRTYWVFICFAWAVTSVFVWHHPKAPQSASRWLVLAALSVVGALIWYGIQFVLVNFVFNSAESELSRIFDVVIMFMISPGLTFIAVAGWIRALVHKKKL